VKVIRHRDEKSGGPVAEFVVLEEGVEQSLPRGWVRELVLPAGLAGKGEEPGFGGGVEPVGDVVGERLADRTGGW
jgi:hypothetical protein